MIFHTYQPFGGNQRPVSERMIREHAAWLTWALCTPAGRKARLPSIPVRKVSEGGFARLLSTPSGRLFAQRWWQTALQTVEDSADDL